MIDPRLEVIQKRLAHVGDVVAVVGGKGGIGKTLVAAALAAALARRGQRTGLFDLDVTGPCAHLVLGASPRFPEEDFGIVPAVVAGVRFLSITCFAGATPAALRGGDVSNALVELLAITRWGRLDTLVVDMPPGLGDTLLDALRLLPQARFLVVAQSSRLVVETVRRTLTLLHEGRREVVGVVENMAAGAVDGAVADLARQAGVPVLAALPADPAVETTLGRPQDLLRTPFGRAVSDLAGRLIADL